MNWTKLVKLRTALYTLSGLASLSICAFLVYTPAGFGVIGLGLFVLEYLADEKAPRA